MSYRHPDYPELLYEEQSWSFSPTPTNWQFFKKILKQIPENPLVFLLALIFFLCLLGQALFLKIRKKGGKA